MASITSILLKKTFGMTGATFLSRILGLVRVRLEAAVLGGGEIASGWFFAFALPNLLRRLFGEGVLTSAIIPMVAKDDIAGGSSLVKKNVGLILTYLALLLSGIVIFISLLALAGLLLTNYTTWELAYFRTPRMQLVLKLIPFLMPYGFFICQVGVLCGILNYIKIFLLPTLSYISLNIFLIAGLTYIYFIKDASTSVQGFLPILSILVVLSGVGQFIFLLYLLKRNNYLPIFSLKGEKCKEVFQDLWRKALPGMIGAGCIQISFLVDRTCASFLGPQAIPALTYVDRIIDLPIGLFAVAMGTVMLAGFSKLAAQKEYQQMSLDLTYALRHVAFLCVPMGVGIIFFYEAILYILCVGGNYTLNDLEATRMVAIFYGFGIPFYCSLKVLLPAFYSRQDMVTPCKVSIFMVIANIVLNFCLMPFLAQGGIALATVITAILQNLILFWLLKRSVLQIPVKPILVSFIRAFVLSFIAAFLVVTIAKYLGNSTFIAKYIDSSSHLTLFIYLLLSGPAFVICYLLFMRLAKSPEVGELFAILRKKKA